MFQGGIRYPFTASEHAGISPGAHSRSVTFPAIVVPEFPSHLVTVWNPSYSDAAMDAYLGILLSWAERHARGEADGDDVYVWWAKLRSENRQQPLPHAREILALQDQIDGGTETHLYLTDYRSLYVALLDEITADDVPGDAPDEWQHMPPYYRHQPADFWFRLMDVRRLVADDSLATIEQLKQLRNVRYNDRPVSLYGGIVELPLIVRGDGDLNWFRDREVLTGGRLWAEHDAELIGETVRMGCELRDNLLGDEVWAALEPGSRSFLASAEAVFRSRRSDPRFDFSGVALSYAKAVEVELNRLIFPLLKRKLDRAKPAEREVHIEGRLLDLGGTVSHQALGVIRTLLEHNEVVRKGIRGALSATDATWLLGQLPPQLAGLAGIRNAAAHAEPVGKAGAGAVRQEVMGIGREGAIARLAKLKVRGA